MTIKSDILTRFLTECTVQSPGDRVQAARLYEAFIAWALSRGTVPMAFIPFSREMKEHCRKIKSGANWWLDLKIIVQQTDLVTRARHKEALDAAWSVAPPEVALEFLQSKLAALRLK